MAYTPVNLSIYIAAYQGACAGLGASGRVITDATAIDYAGQTQIAGAFAQEFDTLYGGTVDTLSIGLVQETCEAVWQGRSPSAGDASNTVPSTFATLCDAVIALIQETYVYFAAQGIPTNIPVAPANVQYVFHTAANYTQPAVDTTVNVTFDATNWLVANAPVFIAGAGLYTVDSITSQTIAVLRNTGVDGNAAPAAVIGLGAYAYLAHGVPWSFTHTTAGTFTNRVPIGARTRLSMRIRPGAGGGGGGGAGGSGFGAATVGGGGSGGAGGQCGGGAASIPIDNIQCVAGETLTIVVGAGGNGSIGGQAPTQNGTLGTFGGITTVTGSTSGPMVRTGNPSLVSVIQGGSGGSGGATGTAAAGGTGKTTPASALKWGYNFGGQATATVTSGAGGAITGANGGAVAAAAQASGTNEFATGTDTIPFWGNNSAGVAGGTGNATNRGGGGAGGPGIGGSFGDMWPIAGGTVETSVNCVGGIPGHGGNADGNAGILPGGNGTDGVNGQGGAGGAGGGGGGSAVTTGGAGANGGTGGRGSDGLTIVSGSML